MICNRPIANININKIPTVLLGHPLVNLFSPSTPYTSPLARTSRLPPPPPPTPPDEVCQVRHCTYMYMEVPPPPPGDLPLTRYY